MSFRFAASSWMISSLSWWSKKLSWATCSYYPPCLINLITLLNPFVLWVIKWHLYYYLEQQTMKIRIKYNTWLSLTLAAALVNKRSVVSEVPLVSACSAESASPLLTFSVITTRSLKFCPKTKPEPEVGGWAGACAGLVVRGVALVEPSGTNLGVSPSSFSLSSASSSLGSSLTSFLSSGGVSSDVFRNGLLAGFNWGGLNTEPANKQY